MDYILVSRVEPLRTSSANEVLLNFLYANLFLLCLISALFFTDEGSLPEARGWSILFLPLYLETVYPSTVEEVSVYISYITGCFLFSVVDILTLKDVIL